VFAAETADKLLEGHSFVSIGDIVQRRLNGGDIIFVVERFGMQLTPFRERFFR
jgi:hypothetical protein